MDYLLLALKAVSVIFAVSAVITGTQAIVDPVGFSRFFGLPLTSNLTDSVGAYTKDDAGVTPTPTATLHYYRSLTVSYVSLMGVRQLATGIILLIFAYQDKWVEIATILAIIGVLVAGTDGIYLSRAGAIRKGRLHAIPGALIAALAGGVIYSST